jgi:ribosome-binding factor A
MRSSHSSSFDRHDRATSILTEIAARYIQREANTNPLITVTNVTISPDYKRTTIFFTTIPDGREEDALIFLKRNATDMRHYIMEHSRLRRVPHLEFSLDYGELHRQHIDEIAHELTEEQGKTSEEIVAELLESGKDNPDTR